MLVGGEGKGLEARTRSESESEEGLESPAADAKLCDLPPVRLKAP